MYVFILCVCITPLLFPRGNGKHPLRVTPAVFENMFTVLALTLSHHLLRVLI